MRNLASIQRVLEVVKHPNADKLDIVKVLGWKCVTGKDNFKVGDLVCYLEVDSILPDEPQFADIKKRGNRIKTIRLRGEISMGLCLPLDVLKGRKFPNDTRENPEYDLTEGTDVTALLGVTKWEPVVPACLGGDVEGAFPDLLPKTDETRIQAYPEILKRYPRVTFYGTEKIDGSSCTMIKKDGKFRICGRNWEFKSTCMNSFRQVAERDSIEVRLPEGYAIQGELAGPGIQGNPLKLKQLELFVFNVSKLDEHKYLDMKDLKTFCKVCDLKSVPIVYVIDDMTKETVDDLVRMATHKSFTNEDVWMEGIVFRPVNEMHDPDLGRLSFKVINPLYLLEHES